MKSFFLLPFLFLLSCATYVPPECEKLDSEGLGYRDGSSGMPQEYAEKRKELCKGNKAAFDRESYNKGHAKGAVAFCTPSHFYFAGETGQTASTEVCPYDKQEELAKNYYEGLQLGGLKERKESLETEINKINNREESDLKATLTLIRTLGGYGPAASKEQELASVDEQIKKMLVTAPDTVEYCAYEAEQKEVVKKLTPSFLLSLTEKLQGTNFDQCSRTAPVKR